MFGPVYDNGNWRIRYDDELYKAYGDTDTQKNFDTTPQLGPHSIKKVTHTTFLSSSLLSASSIDRV